MSDKCYQLLICEQHENHPPQWAHDEYACCLVERLCARVLKLENAIDAHRTLTLAHEDGPGAWDRSLWMLLEEVEP